MCRFSHARSLIQVDEMITGMTLITPALGRLLLVHFFPALAVLDWVLKRMVIVVAVFIYRRTRILPCSSGCAYVTILRQPPHVGIVLLSWEPFVQVGLGSLGVVAEMTLKCTESHDLRLRRFIEATWV